MKVFINILKSVIIFYWVIASGLFSSMFFFPSAIDGLHEGYNSFIELAGGEVAIGEVEEPVTCLAITPECGWEYIVQSGPVLSYTETPVFEVEPVEGDMYVLVDDNDDLFYSLFIYEELATPGACEDDPQTDEDECPVVTTFGWVEYQVSLVEPEELLDGSFWYDVEAQELFVVFLVQQDYSFSPIVLEPLTREEFFDQLETLLVYSVIVMVPFTFLVFSFSKKYQQATSSPKTTVSEKQKDKIVKEKAKVDKKLAKIQSIGVTGIQIKK
jgi:hypothetical protein